MMLMMMMMHPRLSTLASPIRSFNCLQNNARRTTILLSRFLARQHNYYTPFLPYRSVSPMSSSLRVVFDSVLSSSSKASSASRMQGVVISRYSFSSNHDENRRQQSSRPTQQRGQQFVTVTNVLDDYMKSRDRLKPYQVGLVWNKLGKAVQQSRNKREQRSNFWVDNESNLLTLVDHTMQSVDDFNGQSTATVTHSLAKLTYFTDSNLARVQSLWNALLVRTAMHLRSDNLNAQDVSNLLWAYAKVDNAQMHPQLLDALAITAIFRVSEFKPQELSNSAWAFATLNHKAPLLFDAIATAAQERIDEFNPQNLANTAWAFATLNHKAPLLFDAIARTAQKRIDKFEPQGLANVAWAFATLNYKAPSLFDAIARTAQERIDDFKPLELSMIAWTFATLNYKAPSLFDAIARTAQEHIDDFKPLELSMTAWTFATLNQRAPLLFDAIARTAQERIHKFEPQNLSITAWAFATLSHKAPLLLDAISTTAQERIDDFKPQGLANVAWAYATLNHKVPLLFDAIARTAQKRIDKFEPQTLSNTAWAFATLNHEVPELFDAIATAAQERISDFNPQNLANTAWAFATLNYKAPSLFDAVARTAQERIDDFKPQELSNTAWAFAVFNIDTNSLTDADSPFAQILLSTEPTSFSVEDLSQLHQYHLWCRERNTLSWFSDELSCRCMDAFTSQEDTTSQLQNDIMASLETLQEVSQVQEEFRTSIGYSLDAVIVYQGNRIGIEIDGPSHFVGQSQSLNGKTVLKHRQLRTLEGWKLVSIPYWEWNEICDTSGGPTTRESNKQAYLQSMLDGAVVV